MGSMYSVTAAMPEKLSKEAASPRPGRPAPNPRYTYSTLPAARCFYATLPNLIYATRSGNAELQDSGRDRWLRLVLYCFSSRALASPTRWVACSPRALVTETRLISAAVVPHAHRRRADECAYACKDAAVRRERTETACRRKGNRGGKSMDRIAGHAHLCDRTGADQ